MTHIYSSELLITREKKRQLTWVFTFNRNSSSFQIHHIHTFRMVRYSMGEVCSANNRTAPSFFNNNTKNAYNIARFECQLRRHKSRCVHLNCSLSALLCIFIKKTKKRDENQIIQEAKRNEARAKVTATHTKYGILHVGDRRAVE